MSSSLNHGRPAAVSPNWSNHFGERAFRIRSDPGADVAGRAARLWCSAPIILLCWNWPWLTRSGFPVICEDLGRNRDIAGPARGYSSPCAWVERLSKPRLPIFDRRVADAITGLVCVLLAIMLATRLPLGDMLTGWLWSSSGA
jgi:hypothetical protein